MSKLLGFKAARAQSQQLGLNSSIEWGKLCERGENPDGIPRHPAVAYRHKGWKGWPDFLGYKKSRRSRYLPFTEAREIARTFGLASWAEWCKFSRDGQRPKDIPFTPQDIYKDEWAGWGDFLGYEKITFLPYPKAVEVARSLKLNASTDFMGLSKDERRKFRLPANPQQTYGEDWKGWGHFLGYQERSVNHQLSFSEARKVARSLGIKGGLGWRQLCKSGNRPEGIPAHPNQAYKDKGWKGWEDFLGHKVDKSTCGNRYSKNFLPFEMARAMARNLNIASLDDWRILCSEGKRPPQLPAHPNHTYKNDGWISFTDFFGFKNNKPTFLPFKEARKLSRSLKLRSSVEWHELRRRGEAPEGLPANPHQVYKELWQGWEDFLGYQRNRYVSFSQARKKARQLGLKSSIEWRIWRQSGDRPKNIPSSPQEAYKDKGWNGWNLL